MFVCSVCNGGSEFLLRLQTSLEDILHVIFWHLYHSQYTRSKKETGFSIDDDILPCLKEHFESIKLPPKVNPLSLLSQSDFALCVPVILTYSSIGTST